MIQLEADDHDNHSDLVAQESFNNSIHHVHDVFYFSDVTVHLFMLIFLSVFVVGIAGNLLTTLFTIRKKRIWKTMHVYTFNLGLCNLTMLSLYIPTQLVYIKDQLNWNMGIEMCIVTNTILPVSNTCTVGTLLLITFDRFLATTRPLMWRVSFAQRSIPAMNIIFLLWLFSICTNIPLLVNSRLNGTQCIVVWSYDCEYCDYYTFWIVQFVLTYCIPVIVMAVAYPLMARSARKLSREVNRMVFHHKMLVVGTKLVIVFAVCTGFQHFFFFMTSNFSVLSSLPLSILAHWYVVSNWFVSLQAAINPFIYGNLGKIVKFKRLLRIRTFQRYIAATLPVRKWTLRNYGFLGVGIQKVNMSRDEDSVKQLRAQEDKAPTENASSSEAQV